MDVPGSGPQLEPLLRTATILVHVLHEVEDGLGAFVRPILVAVLAAFLGGLTPRLESLSLVVILNRQGASVVALSCLTSVAKLIPHCQREQESGGSRPTAPSSNPGR